MLKGSSIDFAAGVVEIDFGGAFFAAGGGPWVAADFVGVCALAEDAIIATTAKLVTPTTEKTMRLKFPISLASRRNRDWILCPA